MESESYESFEYDENIEGAESGDESSDESSDEMEMESSDEAVETDEDISEVGESTDEAVETDEATLEAFPESEPETDESADEALDEAVSMSASARFRAQQDRSRQRDFVRQLRVDRERDAALAASTQRSITSQIRSIQPGGPARVTSVAMLRGAGIVVAELPNGRRSRIKLTPTLAPVREVNRLRSVVLMNERRQAVATARNSRAITRLATTQAAAVKRLTAQQVKSDKNISQRISQTYSGLDKRITRELAGTGGLGRHGKVMMRQLKLQRQRATWNNILIASSLPFFAAYGTTAKPFAKNNVILTANVLGWLLLDDFVDSFRSKSTTLRGGANIWSYLAPVGNGATAFFLLDKKQHERFLTGFNPVTAATGATVDLTTKIASRSVDDFKKGDRNVVATVVGAAAATTAVVAQVKNGILSLDVSADATVAWVVDTQPQT